MKSVKIHVNSTEIRKNWHGNPHVLVAASIVKSPVLRHWFNRVPSRIRILFVPTFSVRPVKMDLKPSNSGGGGNLKSPRRMIRKSAIHMGWDGNGMDEIGELSKKNGHQCIEWIEWNGGTLKQSLRLFHQQIGGLNERWAGLTTQMEGLTFKWKCGGRVNLGTMTGGNQESAIVHRYNQVVGMTNQCV